MSSFLVNFGLGYRSFEKEEEDQFSLVGRVKRKVALSEQNNYRFEVLNDMIGSVQQGRKKC